ncbi:MAG: hypothetical protein Pg6B_10840 [Candidatus Azobacteroides pseudotrichonymphae]|nr:MAG: hypothetical protein Pg6B_10840 [Candidatus Azobacteroides pseudotrichonymphae]
METNTTEQDIVTAQEEQKGLFHFPKNEHYSDYQSATHLLSGELFSRWREDEMLFWQCFKGESKIGKTPDKVSQMVRDYLVLDHEAFGKRYWYLSGKLREKSEEYISAAIEIAAINDDPMKEFDLETACSVLLKHYGMYDSMIANVAQKRWLGKNVRSLIKDIRAFGSRIPISDANREILDDLWESGKNNALYSTLMDYEDDPFSRKEIYAEQEIYWDIKVPATYGLTKGGTLPAKCKIDRIVVLDDCVYILEVKPIHIPVSQWMRQIYSTCDHYALAFYRRALKENFPEELEGKEIRAYFVLVHIPSRNIYMVAVGDDSLTSADGQIDQIMGEILDSKQNSKTDHTRRYYFSFCANGSTCRNNAGDYGFCLNEVYNTEKSFV